MKRLIVTADDFGAAPEVNEAVEIAHRDGLLLSASLMVGAASAGDAVHRAKRMPNLAIGLHVVVVNGRPVLPAERVPDLVDSEGNFSHDLVRAGVHFFVVPRVRSQLAAEIRAQFEAFAQAGLRLDHVNAQNHMHVHPTVFGLILQIGKEYGMRAIRIPREPRGRTWTIGPWLFLMRARARAAGLCCNDYVLGLNDAGTMTERRVLAMMERLPEGITEIFFHPATGPVAQPDRGARHFRGQDELKALTSRRAADAIAANGITLTTYGELCR